MTIADRAVLVTGANRGIGQALVEEALRRDASRVYAGTRRTLPHPDGRVTPLTFDVTNPEQIGAAVDEVEYLDILVNNAGVLAGPVDTDMSRGLDMPKASLSSVARAIFDGVDNGDEEIFPDPMSAAMADSWRSGPAKALERQYAPLAEAAGRMA
jgi:NAD(P)-dependent dehydrogenase (short-subunit alcohol dehydrogenase family)